MKMIEMKMVIKQRDFLLEKAREAEGLRDEEGSRKAWDSIEMLAEFIGLDKDQLLAL